ncbi:MAG: alanine racemase [Eubacterium sp.]|nr:alanine racemase [Eubacterium sp.]
MSNKINIEQLDTNNVFFKDATLVIKKDAIVNNIKSIKKTTGSKIIAVVKENGYGLGLANLYNIIKDQDIFMYGVTSLCEAIALRKEGCKTDILMLTAAVDSDELLELVSYDVVIALGNKKQIPELKKIYEQTGNKPRVHIKIDSGMGRYGFNVDDIPDFNEYKDFLSIEGCFSHLAGGKNYKKTVEKQVQIFKQALDKIRETGVDTGICHISNSSATMTFGALGFDAVRVGSAILGKVAVKSDLEVSVWLESKVLSIYNRKKGEHIGYGGEAVLKRDSSLAIVRVGTGCGVALMQRGPMDNTLIGGVKGVIKRLLSVPFMSVQINGKSYHVIGRTGISHLAVDVTDTDVKEGDVVKLQVNPLLIHPYAERKII